MITNLLIFFKKSPLLALLNSKRFEISPKNGWRAPPAGEPKTLFSKWRGGGGSNSRWPFGHTAFWGGGFWATKQPFKIFSSVDQATTLFQILPQDYRLLG